MFNWFFKKDKKQETQTEWIRLDATTYKKYVLNLKLTEQELFYIRDALELGFKQMPQDDRKTYHRILKMFQEK